MNRIIKFLTASFIVLSYICPFIPAKAEYTGIPNEKLVYLVTGRVTFNTQNTGDTKYKYLTTSRSNYVGDPREYNIINLLYYRSSKGSQWNLLLWSTEINTRLFYYSGQSRDNLVVNDVYRGELLNTYTFTYEGQSFTPIKYTSIDTQQGNSSLYPQEYAPTNIPRITLNSDNSGNNNLTSILGAISSGTDVFPWEFSDSSGGRHWADGTELSGENVSRYEQTFIVMDSNHDNTVSQEEINYYNYTYNTNYDYQTINEGNDFDVDTFLYYVAIMLQNNETPGGQEPSGGGSNAGGGSISVTDSFTQSQTQTQSIAENAVNVTVENNNALTQENMQDLNNIINNSGISQDGNAFQSAISNISGFVDVARSFGTLCGTVLGFLPNWVTTLLSLMFTILFIMVIFRLIHLFI